MRPPQPDNTPFGEQTLVTIAVVGGGRMGLPLAAAFAQSGARVVVCDLDPALVATVQAGQCPFDEPGLGGLLRETVEQGQLTATTDTTQAAASADFVVIIVPAHLTPEREIDLAVLQSAAADVGRGLRRDTLVAFETTVAVGATRTKLVPVLEQASGLQAGSDFYVAFSPERVKANLVLTRLRQTPKIVGGLNAESTRRALDFYARFLGAPVDDVGTLEAAEMAKLAGMLYRDVNIALANELASFCERAGIDFTHVRTAANSDGEANLLLPGVGVGGHCTPIYPYFLTRASRRLGLVQRLAEAAREINEDQPRRQLERVASAWRPLRGERVHLLGLGFRPGVKVDTFSPAYPLARSLAEMGASVTIEDPHYTRDELLAAGLRSGSVEEASLVILVTAHEEFLRPDFIEWRRAGVEAVLDGRNAWQQDVVEQTGIHYFGIGRRAGLE